MCVSKKGGGKKSQEKAGRRKKQPNKGSSGQNRLLRGRGVQDTAETLRRVWALSRTGAGTEWGCKPPQGSHQPSFEKINKLFWHTWAKAAAKATLIPPEAPLRWSQKNWRKPCWRGASLRTGHLTLMLRGLPQALLRCSCPSCSQLVHLSEGDQSKIPGYSSPFESSFQTHTDPRDAFCLTWLFSNSSRTWRKVTNFTVEVLHVPMAQHKDEISYTEVAWLHHTLFSDTTELLTFCFDCFMAWC